MLGWMAWTWPTAFVFIGIFSAMGVLTWLEIKYPGGDERKGVLGLVTTRGDRLFIALLGSVYSSPAQKMVKHSSITPC